MIDPDAIRRTMSELGITTAELATESGLSPSHVGKQVRGELPFQRRVQRALMGLLDQRAAAIMPHVVRRLREHGEDGAAEACGRVWPGLGEPPDHGG